MKKFFFTILFMIFFYGLVLIMVNIVDFGGVWYSATYKDNIVFTGCEDEIRDQVHYFSVRIDDLPPKFNSKTNDLAFQWKEHRYFVRNLTVENSIKIGEVAKYTFTEYNAKSSVIVLSDESGDYVIELHFKDGIIDSFYARCDRRSILPCPFLLFIGEGRGKISLPIYEENLINTLGPPQAIVNFTGK